MKNKYELVIDDLGSWKIGISLGTAYSINYNQNIKLWNVGYCIKTGEFYFNSNIHLKRRQVKYLENQKIDNNLIRTLNQLGIYDRNDIGAAILMYNDKLNELDQTRQKVFTKIKQNSNSNI